MRAQGWFGQEEESAYGAEIEAQACSRRGANDQTSSTLPFGVPFRSTLVL